MARGPGRGGPKYQQIADDLRARIAAGEYSPGDRLPTKDKLRATYDAALNTVDNALSVLRREGRAVTIQGSGTFVRDPGPDRSPEFQDLERRLDAAETRLEAGEMDVMELYAKLGYEQPSHQQNGGEARDEDAG